MWSAKMVLLKFVCTIAGWHVFLSVCLSFVLEIDMYLCNRYPFLSILHFGIMEVLNSLKILLPMLVHPVLSPVLLVIV